MINKNIALGKTGEYLAKCYLQQKGYDYVRCNYRAEHGEIDLIFIDGCYLVFVEVKTRTFHSAEIYGRGAQKVDKEKQRHLRSAAKEYIEYEIELMEGRFVRFDVVELYIDPDDTKRVVVNHTIDAF